MKLSDIHVQGKNIGAETIFKTTEGRVTALQILENALLKEHITQVPALLVCVVGEVVFENADGLQQRLTSGDYINIEPMVTHWVKGIQNSQLLLIK